MDAKIAFWTYAWFLTAAAVASALVGWREIRLGRVARHRRWMYTAAMLIGIFLVSYVLKLIFLGREDLSSWDPRSVWVLRLHETFIAVMLIAGGVARWRARRFEISRGKQQEPRTARAHRIAGRVTVISALLALASAGVVLLGMYQRATS